MEWFQQVIPLVRSVLGSGIAIGNDDNRCLSDSDGGSLRCSLI